MFAFKEQALWFLLLTLIGHSTGTDNELKLNMVGFAETPTVDDYEKTDIRGYTLGSDRSDNIKLNIELLSYANPSGQPLCDNTDLGEIVQCDLGQIEGAGKESTHLKAVISHGPNDTVEIRFGVFTVYAENGTRNATATMIVHHANAYVKPIVRTKTVSVNDRNVTLGVIIEERICPNHVIGQLRWAKDGINNSEWNNLTEILFETITLVDAGVYECYIEGRRNEGKHAFMQLIVRECPHNKWSPPDCNINCEVCYNGGVCDTYIGTCICPSGFIGTNCEISSGDNRFGRDGDVPCSSTHPYNGCKGKLICPPMPQGCACQAGWKGLDCSTGCEAGKYGADCLQVCHCNDDDCDPSEGCNKTATCHPCYEGERCLNISSVSCYDDDWCDFQSYCFVENNVSWSEAEAECEKLDNGHLVSIHSEKENMFVKDIIRNKTIGITNRTWIGLKYTNEPTWSDGTLYDYPHNMNDDGNNTCVAYHMHHQPEHKTWEKKDCTETYGYICKHRAGTEVSTAMPTTQATSCITGSSTELGTTTDVSGSSTEVHGSTTEVYDSTTEVRSSTTEVHGSTTEVHSPTTDIYGSTTEVHSPTTEIYGSTTEVHGSTTEVYDSTTKVKDSTTEVKDSTTAVHGSTTEVHGSTTEVYDSTMAVKDSTTEVHGSTTEVHGSTTEVYDSTTEVHGSTTEVHGSTTEVHGSTTEVHGSTTEVHGSTTEVHGSITGVHGSTTAVQGSATKIIELVKNLERNLMSREIGAISSTDTYSAKYEHLENPDGNHARNLNVKNQTVDLIISLHWTGQNDSASLFTCFIDENAIKSGPENPIVYESHDNPTKASFYIASGLLTINAYVNETATGANVSYTFSSTGLPSNKIDGNKVTEKTPVCAFINESAGLWSSEGCYRTGTTCFCYHTTSFAVLMQVTEYELHSKVLTWITRTGLVISIVCLMFTLAVYLFFRDLRSSFRNNIHKNLISNIILFDIIFLTGIEITSHKVACKVIAISLHYLLLTVFMWMLSEAVYLHYKVIKVSPKRGNTIAFHMIVCYTAPLVIVIPLAAINFDVIYVTGEICWLTQKGRWAVVVPCALIIMFNFIVLVKLVVIVHERASGNLIQGRKNKQKENKQMKKTVQGTLLLLPILGLTWILGPFVNASTVVAYLFTFTTAFQGLSIFVAYCVFDKEVKAAWEKWKKKKAKNNVIRICSSTLQDTTESTKIKNDVNRACSSVQDTTESTKIKNDVNRACSSVQDTAFTKKGKNDLKNETGGRPAWR